MGPTPLPTLATGPMDLRLVADCVEGQLDLRAFRTQHPELPVLWVSPLVVELEPGRWAYLEKFGAVVCWNPSPDGLRTLHGQLRDLGVGAWIEGAHDELTVHLGATEDRVGFSEVWLQELSLDHLKLISLALAQSVALDHFETAVREALARFQPVVRTLREEGRLRLSPREALKLVGFSFEVRAAVLDNLTLFDDPPETWEDESLARLDSALFAQFDLEERIAAINQKLAYLGDASARVVEILNSRKNHHLEWIVIILIAVEIVLFFWKEMLGTVHP